MRRCGLDTATFMVLAMPMAAVVLGCAGAGAGRQGPDDPGAARDDARTTMFRRLDRHSNWRLVSQIKMSWPTFHTQGLVKVGDAFFVSSVEVLADRVVTGSTDALTDFSIDRTPGAGRGWLFKFDGAGHLLGKVELTEGDRYHPGGIDYDGQRLWVPVAEYRPNSTSQVFAVDPLTLQARKAWTAKDHLGAIVRDRAGGTFHALSWGGRRLYTFAADRADDPDVSVQSRGWSANPQQAIDYQDCHGAGVSYMLCAGVARVPTPAGSVAVGGIDLVDLRRSRPEHQLPVNVYLDDGAGVKADLVVTGNAFWAEALSDRIRFYFMTENDNQADLVVYDVTPWRKPVP
jgi:hypothetical protein